MPIPTFGEARRLLDAARKKLDGGHARQAAEDAWCAAVTAVRTVLYRNTTDRRPLDWRETRSVIGRFRNYEFKRHRSTEMAERLSFLAGSLHGSCFYAGVPAACDPQAVAGGIRAAAQFVADARKFCPSGA